MTILVATVPLPFHSFLFLSLRVCAYASAACMYGCIEPSTHDSECLNKRSLQWTCHLIRCKDVCTNRTILFGCHNGIYVHYVRAGTIRISHCQTTPAISYSDKVDWIKTPNTIWISCFNALLWFYTFMQLCMHADFSNEKYPDTSKLHDTWVSESSGGLVGWRCATYNYSYYSMGSWPTVLVVV